MNPEERGPEILRRNRRGIVPRKSSSRPCARRPPGLVQMQAFLYYAPSTPPLSLFNPHPQEYSDPQFSSKPALFGVPCKVTRGLTILVAEDDPNDVLLLKRAFLRNGLNNPVHTSPDGEDAINYLQGKGVYQDRARYPFPSLLITDLKMPRSTGFEILKWLRAHPDCHIIPVIVFSASRQDEDVLLAYRYGANAFIHKPPTFDKLTEVIRITADFWNLCEKPPLPPVGCPG